MSKLLSKAGVIYDYLKVKPWVKTYMTVRPKKTLVLKQIEGIGFKLKKVKKDFNILLDQKDRDWHCKVILAYYSMNLVPAFLLEGCVATLIKNAISKGSYKLGEFTELEFFFPLVKTYSELF